MTAKYLTKLVFLCLLLSLTNCSRKPENFTEDIRVKRFVWGAMNAYYIMQDSIPDLADNKFKNDEQLHSFLKGYDSPEDLFKALKIKDENQSEIISDYTALSDGVSPGITRTNGIKWVKKSFDDGTENVSIYITDVIEGSPAADLGINRGESFNKIDDEILTESNYESLLSKDTYKIVMLDGTTSYELTKKEINQSPIQLNITFKIKGKNIGYLLYNEFSPSSDKGLNAAFLTFKTDTVKDLILDLRYNKSGSIATATHLASMITGQFTDSIFCKEQWNSKVMKNINKTNFTKKFTDEINTDAVQQNINNLELKRVYIITSEQTASISEILIGGLKAYIDVKLIGTKTAGNHKGSIKLYDAIDYKKGGKNFNTTHSYVLDLFAFEFKNSKDENNKGEGYTPDIIVNEAYTGKLGEIEEPALKAALESID